MSTNALASHPTRVRTAIAWGANGQPRTYRLAAARQAAYRRLAVAILGLDVATLAHELRSARRQILAHAA
jgi:hypothetical protein